MPDQIYIDSDCRVVQKKKEKEGGRVGERKNIFFKIKAYHMPGNALLNINTNILITYIIPINIFHIIY